jgi:hydroxymethylbilane synthase
MKKGWIIGTRGSSLALRQTELVVEALQRAYPEEWFIIKTIKTKGDTIWDRPIPLIGGKGLFVKEIEEALLKGDIDLAVHSMKDLPSELHKDLTIGATLEREDPRDCFVSERYPNIEALKEGALIGTGSPRRASQLLSINKGIKSMPIRGNIETRIRKMKELDLDGVILAYAGVKRMGLEGLVKEVIPLEIMTPSAGQGSIGVEIRDEREMKALLMPINHERTFLESSIERAIQSKIGGGCNIPLGINAHIDGEAVSIHLFFSKIEGEGPVKRQVEGNIDDKDILLARLIDTLAIK